MNYVYLILHCVGTYSSFFKVCASYEEFNGGSGEHQEPSCEFSFPYLTFKAELGHG